MNEEAKAVLCLDRATDDAQPFSAEYQEELSKYSAQMKHAYQRAFAMDSISGGGGPLGEFIFNNGTALVSGVSAVAVAWVGARFGRKVRLKVGDVEVEAKNPKEVEQLLTVARDFAAKNPASPAPVAPPPKR